MPRQASDFMVVLIRSVPAAGRAFRLLVARIHVCGGGARSLTSSVFFQVSGRSFRSPFQIVGLAGFDHLADDVEEPIRDASEGARVAVAAASQRMILRPAGGVALDGGHGPVAGGVDQPPVRGESPSSVPIVLQFRPGMSRPGFAFGAPRSRPEA